MPLKSSGSLNLFHISMNDYEQINLIHLLFKGYSCWSLWFWRLLFNFECSDNIFVFYVLKRSLQWLSPALRWMWSCNFPLCPPPQEHAFESSQKYKEGKFIIELAHMIKDNGWEWRSGCTLFFWPWNDLLWTAWNLNHRPPCPPTSHTTSSPTPTSSTNLKPSPSSRAHTHLLLVKLNRTSGVAKTRERNSCQSITHVTGVLSLH